MNIDGINPPQARQSAAQTAQVTQAATPLEGPAFTAPVVSKAKRPVGKIIGAILLVVLVLALVAGAAYGGYYWEHARAVKAENDLQATITYLQAQLRSAQAAQQSSSNTNAGNACNVASLALAEAKTTGAAGTFGITYSVTNKSSSACTLSGYPTVTLLDANSQQVGQPAQDASTAPAGSVTVKPNEVAYLTVLFPNAANFAAGACNATKPAAIRIVPAGQTVALQTAIANQSYCPGFATQAFTTTAP